MNVEIAHKLSEHEVRLRNVRIGLLEVSGTLMIYGVSALVTYPRL
jgi:hypothetical protein